MNQEMMSLIKGFEDQVSGAGIIELLKAMEANEGVTDVSQLAGASALQPQSLEATVVSLLFDESYFKVMNRIEKNKTYSTLHEYTKRTSFGQYNRGGVVGQMENPRQGDPAFKRDTANIKFQRELWSISSVLAASKTITDTEVEAKDAATMRLMETAEYLYFFGDSSIIPEEPDGLDATIERQPNNKELIIDLRGAKLSESVLKEACKRIADKTGLANDMYISYNVQNQIDQMIQPASAGVTGGQRMVQNNGNLIFDLGYLIPGFKATFALNGRVTFIPDFFLKPEDEGVPTIINQNGNTTEGATSDMAPAMPTILSAAAGPLADTEFAAPYLGATKYRVAGQNRFGKSKASTEVSVTIGAGQAATLVIQETGQTNFADGYVIYRETKPGNGIFRRVTRIARDTSNVNLQTTWVDKNTYIPGTSSAYIGDFNSRGANTPLRTTSITQLMPVHSTRYSIIGPYLWGAVNFYWTPIFYAINKFIKIRNIGIE